MTEETNDPNDTPNGDPKDDPKDVGEWLEIAKRATEVVGKVDLDRIVEHHPDEVEKLSRVVETLESLEQGAQVEYVPGIDEDEAPSRELNPDELRRVHLFELLEPLGEERLGRVYFANAEIPMKSLEYVPHRDGLPAFDFCLAPDHSPVDGAHGVFVSSQGIFAAVIGEPLTEHRWRIAKSVPYDSDEDLLEIVSHMLARP